MRLYMEKIPHTWSAKCESGCFIAGYDFQLYKKSDPPPIDWETPVIPLKKNAAPVDGV